MRRMGPAPDDRLFDPGSSGGGALATNIAHFAGRCGGWRADRTGAVLDALAAVEARRIRRPGDFYTTLHACSSRSIEHSLLFDQAFEIFWRRRGLLEKLIAMLSPQPRPEQAQVGRGRLDSRRRRPDEAKPAQEAPSLDRPRRRASPVSDQEILRARTSPR